MTQHYTLVLQTTLKEESKNTKVEKWRREKKDWLIRTKNPELRDLAIDLVL